jgi:hypothetical protein
MPLKDYFTYRDDADIRLYAYIKKADTIGDLKSLEFREAQALQAIADCKATIETLEEYRKTLFARYQEIASAPYKLVLRLERNVKWDNSKSYIITLFKRYDGAKISDEEVKRETFPGKERHKALKRFEELKKEYPTTETEIDIEKRRWEK